MPVTSLSDAQPKRIAVLGFGREGKSALDWVSRNQSAAAIWVFDESVTARRPVSLDRSIGFESGPMNQGALNGFDQIIKSPGVPLNHPVLQAAEAVEVDITSGTNLWFDAHGSRRTIGVTGTKGKSTTASLIAHLLRAAGESVELAGNVGRPLLDVATDTDAWVVVELSSYQLADFDGEIELGLLLNIFSEHLDWHGSDQAYQAAKLRLLERSDLTLAGSQVLRNFPELNGQVRAVEWGGSALKLQEHTIDTEALPLRGEHNLENIQAAFAVLDQLGITVKDPAVALATFKPLPHRLESVAEHNGIRFVDDSISTTPESTLAALRAYSEASTIVLVGGFDRGLDWQKLASELAASPPLSVICLPDSGPEISRTLRNAGVEPVAGIHEVENLSTAVTEAVILAEQHGGNLILLSPGAPSFGQFRDYRERGEVFRRCIQVIAGKP